MRVCVRRAGLLTETLPVGGVGVECPPAATLGDLLRLLEARYGAVIGDELLAGDRLRDGVAVLVDGRSAASLAGLQTPLNDGAEVFLTVIIQGGAGT
jgi:molybdopterin converting factor small subunit